MDAKNWDVVIFSLFRTDHEYSSVSLSWAKEFAKNNRVFYVNHPYSLRDFFSKMGSPKMKERAKFLLTGRIIFESIPQIPENFVSIQPGLTLPINWLPPGPVYDFFQRLNNRVVLRAIKKIIQKFGIRDFVFLNCYDPYYAGFLPKEFGQKLSIYQCIDDISQDPYSLKHGKKLEAEAISKSDFALVTSTQLRKILSVHNPETYVAQNAVDISIFEKTLTLNFPKPAEIARVKTPIIGFTGNLDYLRIDYGLLKKIAERHRDKTLVLVGPINSQEFYEKGLDKMPNVIFTGGKRIEELPAYLQHMDVCIIPFLCNTLTESIYPLKINEYLAAGKPIVATSFSDDIREFHEVIYLAENSEQFLNLLDRAIVENREEKIQNRVAVARENTWEARVNFFWKLVKNHFERTEKKSFSKV